MKILEEAKKKAQNEGAKKAKKSFWETNIRRMKMRRHDGNMAISAMCEERL
jgi:hypothetical protein